MNSNNKRNKNRPGGSGAGGGGGGSGLSRYSNDNRLPPTTPTTTVMTNNKLHRPPAQGVYSNSFFMHSATALVGSLVKLRLRSGNVYEGVFRTFSSDFDVALDLPQCIQPKKGLQDEETSGPKTVIFPYDTVVNISAIDFDFSYATVGAFQTDAAISEKCNGTRFEEKELEPWDASGLNGDIDIELDGAANGWDPNEMFRKNENQFGVTSTFDDSLSTYTVQIDKKDSEEFKEAELLAEKLAAEIENNPACRDRLDLENGDEETLFAAVERPTAELERERERERSEMMEREREREHREREQRDRKPRSYEPRSEPMPERYIVKPTRSITGPSPPVASANAQPHNSGNSMTSSSSSSTAGQTSRMHHERNERNNERNDRNDNERSERMMNSNPAAASTMTSVPPSGQMSSSSSAVLSNPTQPPTTNSGMKSSMNQATQVTATSPMITSSTVSTSTQPMDNNNGGNMGNGNKYGGGPIMKRKNAPQGNKLVRSTPPPSGSLSGGNSGGGNGNNLAPSGNNNNSGGKGSNVGTGYQSVSMQGQSNYQSYPQVHGPIYRSSHMGSSSAGGKIGSDANSSKSMAQRGMRQYSGSQPNSGINYNDAQNQINKPHGPPSQQQGGSSPPLQNAPTQHGGMIQQQGVMNLQSAPQSQRQMRTRESHMQDLRQFGHDFQLAPSSNQGPVMQAQQQQHQAQQQHHHQQQQQQVAQQQSQQQVPQQQQAPPPQMHMQMGGNKVQQQQQQQQQSQQQQQQQSQQQQHHHQQQQQIHHHHHQPQPSVSPPQQQQQHQQQPPPLQQQQQQQQQHMTQHVAMPQHMLPQQQPQHMQPPQLHAQTVQHYVPANTQLVQTQLPPQAQQFVPAHLVQQQPKVVQHITALPQPQPTQLITAGVPMQQQQMPPPQQPGLVQQPQISPVVMPASPVLEQPPQQVQMQQPPPPQQQQISKNDGTNMTPPTQQQQQQTTQQATQVTMTATVPNPNIDKATTPPAISSANGNAGVATSTTTTTTVKKTHVLNPSAKPFTPRSPSTPNPSRPHTPQTPVPQMTSIYTTATAATPAPNQVYIMPPPPQQTATAFQAPAHPQGGQPPRLRRSHFAPMTASQINVSASAATGQPLLAGAPMQQFLHYQQTPHAAHFQTQPYAAMMRMYDPQQQQLQFIAQTPPSTTPSPGQPHQAFHPAPQPSPAGGAPQPAFTTQTQPPTCQIMCPLVYPPQLVQNPYYPAAPHPQPQGQQFQIVMQSHPAQ